MPTLYFDRIPLQSDDKPFAAGVRYLNLEDCAHLMQKLLDNYNLWTFEGDDSWSSEQSNEYSQSSATALHTFRTLSCRQSEFATEEAAEQTLRDDNNAPEQTLLGNMTNWCDALLETHDGNDGEDSYKFAEFDDVQSLGEYVEEYTLPFGDYEAPSLWPLVERVR